MNSKVIIVILIIFSIMMLAVLTNFLPSAVVLVPLGLIAISSVFFSRGILIFLTILCLAFATGGVPALQPLALNFRWVFFTLFCLHIFGDIFLGRTVRKFKVFDMLAIIFIIYAFISASYSLYPKMTTERTMTVFALYFSVFWVIWKYAYDHGPEKVAHLVLQAAMFMFILSYLMIFIGPYRPFMGGRFAGIFANPNGLGVMCAILLPLSLWQFLETQKRTALFLFIIILLALFLSAARGSINAAVIAVGYLMYVRAKKYRPLFTFSLISLILIVMWVIETLIKEFFKSYIRVTTLSTLGGRLEAWQAAINLFMDKAIFGYGFGTEGDIFKLKKITFRVHAGGFVHNSYLGMLLQLGMIGFIIFFIPLFVLLYKELFSKTQDDSIPLLRYALQASFIGGLICCLYESWVYSVGNAQAFPFWIIIMLLLYYRYRKNEEPTLKSA